VTRRFGQHSDDLEEIEEKDRLLAEKQKAENERRINDAIHQLESELSEIEAAVQNKSSEAEQICAQVEIEATPIRTQYNSTLAILNRKRAYLQVLRIRLQNLPVEPVVGGGDNRSPRGNRPVAESLEGMLAAVGSSSEEENASQLVSENQWTNDTTPRYILAQNFGGRGGMDGDVIWGLDGKVPNPERERLQREILSLSVEIRVLERQIVQLETSYKAVTARCTSATQQFNVFLRQKENRRYYINRELRKLASQLKGNEKPARPSTGAQRVENRSEALDEYFTYPLEQRRQELLQAVGCGNSAQQEAPDPGDKPEEVPDPGEKPVFY
jgi:septal ring factor EnvC (AmiA/AmiB activator)